MSSAARSPQEKLAFQKNLLRWYGTSKRALPWRKTRDPYKILISEMLLQQTRVETATDYYKRLTKRFPTIRHLANASQESVLREWQGLGYYGRARNLHRTAKLLWRDAQGRIPSDPDKLKGLPGIGPYTAAAVASIAFDRDVAVLDGNVIRVLCRVFMIRDDPTTQATRNRLEKTATNLLPKGEACEFNQALMELGALVCRPLQPACPACPVKSQCRAFRDGKTHRVPLRKQKNRIPVRRRVVALIIWRGRILLTRRPSEGLLGGLWELPGQTAKRQETEERVRRELEQTLRKVGLMQSDRDKPCAVVKHTYSHFQEELRVYRYRRLRATPADPKPKMNSAWKWVFPTQLSRYPVTGATKKILSVVSLEPPGSEA